MNVQIGLERWRLIYQIIEKFIPFVSNPTILLYMSCYKMFIFKWHVKVSNCKYAFFSYFIFFCIHLCVYIKLLIKRHCLYHKLTCYHDKTNAHTLSKWSLEFTHSWRKKGNYYTAHHQTMTRWYTKIQKHVTLFYINLRIVSLWGKRNWIKNCAHCCSRISWLKHLLRKNW